MDWLESQLSHAPTPSSIVHLGAGFCSDLPVYIRRSDKRIYLVEPNPEILPELKQRADGQSRVEVLPVAVATEAERRPLKLLNYPELSSLRRPTGLFKLLPGLRQTGQATVSVHASHEIVKDLGLSGNNNWLIIEALGEESAIIADLDRHNQLQSFSHVIVRAGAESLYEGAATSSELVQQLQQLGYFNEGSVDDNDRDWPRYHFRVNPKAIECSRLKEEKHEIQATLKKLQDDLEEHKKARADLERKLKEVQEKERADKQALTKEVELFQKQLAQAKEQAGNVSEIKALIKNMEQSMRGEVQRSRVRVESYMALNKYLEYGELAPSFHGWTISPDLGMELVRALEENDYDLVIEFGSGVSTVLMAQVMYQRASQSSKLSRIVNSLTYKGQVLDPGSRESPMAQGPGATHEIPARIIAFEHSWKFLESTRKSLLQAGVNEFVNLVHAPLQEYSRRDSTYLFYDCGDELHRAARVLQKERSKILVLVDGPPGNTNAHARYPALPFLLDSFSGHQIDLILDDYERADEIEIIEMWKEELKTRGLGFEERHLALEKGACFIYLR